MKVKLIQNCDLKNHNHCTSNLPAGTVIEVLQVTAEFLIKNKMAVKV